jgi:hypothetical protein
VKKKVKPSSEDIGIYAILSDQDRRDRIRGLGSEQGNGSELGDVIGQLEMLLARLKAKS